MAFLRSWARTPGAALTAILTLALGIGASTALFTFVDRLLIRPLPYRAADRLVMVRAEQDFEGAARPVRALFPAAAVADWPTLQAFQRVAFVAEGAGALSQPTGSEVIGTAIVDGPFFETLEGPMLLGRGLSPADGADPMAVIGERLWRRHFGGTSDVLGRSITLNGQVLTIVGVAGAGLQVPRPTTEVWISAATDRLRNPGCCGFVPLARLTEGASVDTALVEVTEVTRALATRFPRSLSDTRVQVIPLREAVVGAVRPALIALAGAVGLLLALAVANVSSLLLARHAVRAHEIGIRRALGASTSRIVRDAAAECAWLCAAGCVLGVALATIGVRLLVASAGDALPRPGAIAVDGIALLFAVGVAIAVTAGVALLPLAVSTGRGPGHDRTVTASPVARRLLRAITVGQLAASVVLLVTASLLARSLVALLNTDMGVRADRVATASINLAMDRTLTSQQQVALVSRVVERVASAPGVVAAGVGTSRPPDVSRMRVTLTREGDTVGRAPYQAAGIPVTPGYFDALGISLQRGRVFTDADQVSSEPVVILSAGTARRMFPDRDAVGQRLRLPVVRDGKTSSEDMTVVGVVGNVKFAGLDQEADDAVYRPFAQQPWVSAFLVARTTGDADALAGQLRAETAAVDRAIAVADVRSMDAVLSTVTAEPRLRSLTLLAFAVMAVVIAGVGLHGVVAYSVSRRRAEIGVRMALGADGPRIRRMVLGEGLALAMAGGVTGLVSAVAATRLVHGLLFGITWSDPLSYGVAGLGVITVGLAATYLPARRAAQTDPATILRGE